MDNLKWLLIAVLVLLGLYFIMQSRQSGYATQTDRVFPENGEKVARLVFEKDGQSLALVKQDTTWTIAGNDTLQVRSNRINSFFDQAFKVKRETMMTQKPENWIKYSVDDSTGSHVKVYDASDKLLVHAIFGRSTSDWARNYVRIGDQNEVYLTDQNAIYQVNTTATYWGEKPPPLRPVVRDSVGTQSFTPVVMDSIGAQ